MALSVVLVGSLYQALCHTEAFADDAAISFAYSRQLADTGEFIHTASSERVEGFSNPTWTVLCALPFLLHMDPYIFARTVGVICLLMTILLVFRTSARLLSSSAARFAPPLLVGMAPCVCFWTMAGLENPLFTLLVAALIWQAVREELDGAKHWSGLIAVGLALSRPEGVIYALPIAIYKGVLLFRRAPDERRALIWRHVTNALWLIAPLAAFLLWRRLYFSEWLPNTFFAKLTATHLLPQDATDESRGMRYVKGFFDVYYLWPLAYGAAIAVFVRKRWPEAILALSMVGTHLAFVFIVDGDWMGDFRFFSLAMPAYALLLGMVIQGCADLLARLPARWWPRVGTIIEQATSGALLLYFLAESLLPTLSEYERAGWVSMNLVRQQGIGLEMIARNTGLLRASAALPDVGGSAMDTNLQIIDTVGLVDPVIARSKARPGRIRQYFLEEARPDFYQAHSHWRRYYNFPLHFDFRRDYVELPEALSKRLMLLGVNYMRREHLTAPEGEAEHSAYVDLGRGLVLLGYDDPIQIEDQLILRLYVESQGEPPQQGDLLTVSRRADGAVDSLTSSLDLGALPSDLFEQGELLRLRLKSQPGAIDGIAPSGPSEQESLTWLPAKAVVAGRRGGADLERFLLYPRTHFACAMPLAREKRQLLARGRLQIFDRCRPLYRADEVERLITELRRRAAVALHEERPRVAVELLSRAELLAPESRGLRRVLRRAALASYRQSEEAARRGDLEAAQRLAVDALRADPLLARARALTHELLERGLQSFPDDRERAEIALDRLRQTQPTRARIVEMLRAILDANRPLDGARALDEIDRHLIDNDELRFLAGKTFLDLGLCERTLEIIGDPRPQESCHVGRLRSQAGRLCGRSQTDEDEDVDESLCEALGPFSERRSVFEFEGVGLEGWEVSEELSAPEEKPEFYVSGFSGRSLLRTDWAGDSTYRALSPEFMIDQPRLSVQVGGGSLDDDVSVELVVDGHAVHRGAGEQDHHLRRISWNVSELQGQRARIRVIDQGRGQWGFILVDHVRLHPSQEFDPSIEDPK